MGGAELSFTWDATKSDACLRLRGFDFAYAAQVFEGAYHDRPDLRRDYGERRMQAIGLIEGVPFVVVYTVRGDVWHIISARRAHWKEWDRWLTSG